jgi:hypothetical protein
MHRLSVVFVVLLAAACGAPQAAPEATPTWHHDVAPIVERSCAGCHVKGGIAPFALTTYAEVKSMGAALKAAVEARRMPPFLASHDCAEYLDDPSLSAGEIASIGKWVDADAPEGTPEAVTNKGLEGAGLTRVDVSLQMPIDYTPQLQPDDYRCFVIDWPYATTKYVTGFRAKPGNASVVHHVIGFLIPPERVAAYQKLDDDEAGAGYTCFGGAGAGNDRAISWVGAWAPGGAGNMYADGTGLGVAPGSKIVIQVHYNSRTASPGSDRTTLEMALADEVRHKAILAPFTNPDWPQGVGMEIPAYQMVTHSWSFDPTPYLGLMTNGVLESNQAMKIHMTTMHQHLLGTTNKLWIDHADGTKECLVDIPRWDFHWQRNYQLKKARVLKPGDKLSLSCTWDNTAENQPVIGGVKQTSHDVKWGESTTDEMCLGVVYVTE